MASAISQPLLPDHKGGSRTPPRPRRSQRRSSPRRGRPGASFSSNDSAFAFTRVATAGDAMPQVPTLSAGGAPAGHFLEIPYRGSFQLHYDVRSVPHADGTAAEFSAPGPTSFNLYNTFNNPNAR